MGLNVCVCISSWLYTCNAMCFSNGMEQSRYTRHVLIANINTNASPIYVWREGGNAQTRWRQKLHGKAKPRKRKMKLHRALTDGEWWMAYYGAFKVLFLFVLPRCWRLETPLPPTPPPPIADPTLIHNGWEHNVQFFWWEKSSAKNSTPNEIDICFNGRALAGEGLIFHKQQPVIGST